MLEKRDSKYLWTKPKRALYRLPRQLLLSPDSMFILAWWASTAQEVFPWAPQLREQDVANVMLFSIKNPQEPKSLGFIKTLSDPLAFRYEISLRVVSVTPMYVLVPANSVRPIDLILQVLVRPFEPFASATDCASACLRAPLLGPGGGGGVRGVLSAGEYLATSSGRGSTAKEAKSPEDGLG